MADDITRLRQIVAADPFDMQNRAILADALEESGSDEARLQRQLIAFVRLVQQTVNQASSPHQGHRVGVTDGPSNCRVFTSDPTNAERSLFAWVSKKTGMVCSGTWQAPSKPDRFSLHDCPEVWAWHVGPGGLANLNRPSCLRRWWPGASHTSEAD
jgi:hypothetical protein